MPIVNETLKPLIVGIDPGVSTGVAIYNRKTSKVLTWCTKDFFSVQEYLMTVLSNINEAKVFVEHPFAGHVKTNRAKGLTGGSADVYTANAGGNRREAQLLAESLRRHGFDVELVNPVREAKWDATRFRLFTGSSKAASQHERDAVRIAVYYANKRQERK